MFVHLMVVSPALAAPSCPVPVERVSVGTDGQAAQGDSRVYGDTASAEGRYVVFGTDASLDAGDVDGATDVYLRDRTGRKTSRISRKCSPGFWQTDYPSISADGRWVTYLTEAPCDPSTAKRVLYLFDRLTDQRSVASLDASGNPEETLEPASLSSDGRFFVYTNGDAHIVLRDLQTGTRRELSTAPSPADDDEVNLARITPNGRFVTFLNQDPNGDSFVTILVDLQTSAREVVSIGPDGSVIMPSTYSISGDGRYVAFDKVTAGGIYLRDRLMGTTALLSETGEFPVISASGRYVAYSPDFEDGVVLDRWLGRSVSLFGALGLIEPEESVRASFFSGDERYLILTSSQRGLVPDDFNDYSDVFAVDVATLFADPGNCATPTPETQPGSPSASFTPDPNGDPDQDGIKTSDDNCPYKFNPGQQDRDKDGKGDFCDLNLSRSALPAASGCSLVPR